MAAELLVGLAQFGEQRRAILAELVHRQLVELGLELSTARGCVRCESCAVSIASIRLLVLTSSLFRLAIVPSRSMLRRCSTMSDAAATNCVTVDCALGM